MEYMAVLDYWVQGSPQPQIESSYSSKNVDKGPLHQAQTQVLHSLSFGILLHNEVWQLQGKWLDSSHRQCAL